MSLARAEEFYFDRKAWLKEYGPHDGQWTYHSSDARFRVIVAGRRWGKSLSAAKEAEAMILTPGTRGWVVSKTYDLTEKVIRQIYRDLIMDLRLEEHMVKHRAAPYYMEFDWGSVVEGKSAAHPESLLGEGLDWLIFDECAKCKQSVWEMYLRPTLTDREGWALFITTPNGYNWLHDLYLRGKDDDHPDWQSFKSPSWENPHLSRTDIDEARQTLSEAAFAQEYGADFTMAAGQVYKEFDEAYHVISESEMQKKLQQNWPRYRAIDFGYENPYVVLYFTVDPQDRIYLYKEIYEQHKTNPEMAAMMTGGFENVSFEWTTADPSNTSDINELRKVYGFYILPAKSDLSEISLVHKALKQRIDGTFGFYVSNICRNTIREFNNYMYPETGNTEKPKKENDHCMDAIRYFISTLRRGGIRQHAGDYYGR